MAIATVDFAYIRDLVRTRSAIVLETGKEYLVESRLEPLARKEGINSVGELVSRLKTQGFGRLHAKVIEAMTTNETSFFRDSSPFDALRNVIIPELVAKRKKERRLAIWSAASSSGQEIYSVAIMLKEMAQLLDGFSITLLATDINAQMVARSREGRYNTVEVSRGLTPAQLSRFFDRNGSEFQVKQELRRMVEFRELNLAGNWIGIPNMDIILLRNVMIYFDVETRKGILARVRQTLLPGGSLFLGAAETTNNVDDNFERVIVDKVSTYRVKGK